jgi:Domain of unknown function (DUF6531)
VYAVTVALITAAFVVLLTAADADRANAAAIGDVPYCWDAAAGVPVGHAVVAGAVEYCVAPEVFRVALAGVSPSLPAGSGSLELDASSLFKFTFRRVDVPLTTAVARNYNECRTMDMPTSPVLYLSCGGTPQTYPPQSYQKGGSYTAAVRSSAAAAFTDVILAFSQPIYDMREKANTAPVLHATGAKLFAPEGAIFCSFPAMVGYYNGPDRSNPAAIWQLGVAAVQSDYSVCSLPYSVMVAMGMDVFECVSVGCGIDFYAIGAPFGPDIQVLGKWGCNMSPHPEALMPGRMNDPTFFQFWGGAGYNITPENCGGMAANTARWRPNGSTPWATLPITYTAPAYVTNGAGAVPSAFGAVSKTLIGGAKGMTTVADPVNTATGSFTHSETDLVAPDGSAGLRFERWYDSADQSTGALGFGWTSAWSDTLRSDGAAGFTFIESTGRTTSFRPALGGTWTHPVGVDASLVLRPDGSPALLYTNGDVLEFNVAGLIEQRFFADGQSLTVVRDAASRVLTVTSSSGAALTFTYTALNSGKIRLTSVAGSWGQSVTYTYGTGDRLATATRPGAANTYTYEPAKGLLTAVTDACPWPCHSPRWWPTKVLAVVS